LDDAKVRGFLCYFGLKSLNFWRLEANSSS
jgi:hypothetical protein